jgi:hypothetical protein
VVAAFLVVVRRVVLVVVIAALVVIASLVVVRNVVVGGTVAVEQTFTPLNTTLVMVGKALEEGYRTLKPTVLNTVPAF